MRRTYVLYNEINVRAERTFQGDPKQLAKDEWPKWYQHWMDTTKSFRDEAKAEGLANTAKELDGIIAETIKDHPDMVWAQ